MTEQTKTSENWDLPKVDFPKMDMPEAPKTGLPADVPHPSSDGGMVETMNRIGSSTLPPADGRPRILIGVPILTYSHEFVQSFLRFWTEICTQMPIVNGKPKMQVGFHFVHRRPVHMAEIDIVEVARFNNCTHVLFMDDDIYDVHLSDLEKLVDADKEVIGGVMYASKFPYAMCVFRRYDTNRKVIDMPADNSMYRLYEVPCLCNKCGTGLSHWDAKFCLVCGAPQDNLIQKADLIPFPFTLMKLSIFDKIKRPWFHCTEGYPTDSWFGDRCIEAGIQEYAHMGIRLNHNGINDATKPFYLEMGLQKQKASGQGIVNLTPEEMAKHQYLLHNKMLEAEKKAKEPISFIGGSKDVSKTSSVEKTVQETQGVKVPG